MLGCSLDTPSVTQHLQLTYESQFMIGVNLIDMPNRPGNPICRHQSEVGHKVRGVYVTANLDI